MLKSYKYRIYPNDDQKVMASADTQLMHDDFADVYDTETVHMSWDIKKWVKPYLPIMLKSKVHVLDVACGTGL